MVKSYLIPQQKAKRLHNKSLFFYELASRIDSNVSPLTVPASYVSRQLSVTSVPTDDPFP